jgi:hypothetical protein
MGRTVAIYIEKPCTSAVTSETNIRKKNSEPEIPSPLKRLLSLINESIAMWAMLHDRPFSRPLAPWGVVTAIALIHCGFKEWWHYHHWHLI